MATSTIVGIVIAVVAALLIIAVLAWAVRRRGEHRRRVQAEQIRERVDQQSVHVQRREAFADETAAKARAAQAEAEAKAAEAARLQQRAEAHHSNAAGAREQLDEQRAHADSLDPRATTRPEESRQPPGQAGPTDTPRAG